MSSTTARSSTDTSCRNNMSSSKVFEIQTQSHSEILDITGVVQGAIRDSGVQEGMVLVYCPHTTAAITINENGDPDVKRDLLTGLDILSPKRGEYRHFEGNSDAHLKSSLVGASELLVLQEGRLVLGTWQSVYFCEFDGPRRREFIVKIMEG